MIQRLIQIIRGRRAVIKNELRHQVRRRDALLVTIRGNLEELGFDVSPISDDVLTSMVNDQMQVHAEILTLTPDLDGKIAFLASAEYVFASYKIKAHA